MLTLARSLGCVERAIYKSVKTKTICTVLHISPEPLRQHLHAMLLRQNSAVLKQSEQKNTGADMKERRKERKKRKIEKGFNLVLNNDPKTKAIIPINKPFVQALSDQENLPARTQHTDMQVQCYQSIKYRCRQSFSKRQIYLRFSTTLKHD